MSEWIGDGATKSRVLLGSDVILPPNFLTINHKTINKWNNTQVKTSANKYLRD